MLKNLNLEEHTISDVHLKYKFGLYISKDTSDGCFKILWGPEYREVNLQELGNEIFDT